MNKFAINLVAGPTSEPLTVLQAKQHLRVDFPDDDALIAALITASREYVENYTNRVLFTQTWQLSLDQFPYQSMGSTTSPLARESWFGSYLQSVQISLPVTKVQSVTSITYDDGTGTVLTLDPTRYHVDVNSQPARIVPVAGGTWPYPPVYTTGTVNITFIAGSYTPATCPSSIKQVMLLLIGAWYNQREAFTDRPLTAVPMAVECLLAPYRNFQVSF